MADLPGLLGANNFQQLTPEQLRRLDRDRISTEAYSPFDFMSGVGVGGFASLIGKRLAGAASEGIWPTLGVTGGLMGLGGGLGYMLGPYERDKANMIRDAEGQPGGFYGAPPMRR